MKDKKEQLAEEAGFVFWSNEEWKPEGQVIDWSSVYDKELEKFAELIARECASIVYQACEDGDAGAMAILYEFDVDGARSHK